MLELNPPLQGRRRTPSPPGDRRRDQVSPLALCRIRYLPGPPRARTWRICRILVPGPYHAVVTGPEHRFGVALVMVSCVGLVTGGCAASRQQLASAATHPATAAAGLGRRAAAVRYLAIAQAGNRRLEVDFDQLAGRDRGRLAAAEADLRDAATTERLFDRRLVAIVFPAATEPIARLLFRVNQSRASLTVAAAASVSLRQLGVFERRLRAADEPVEEAVRVIRGQLGLPPPETS